MTISVVIPTLIKNNKHLALTLQCIEKAETCTEVPFETIIVETCSNYLEDFADIYLHEPEKTNDVRSFNNGFKHCNGDYVCFLTNDVLVDNGWLESLVECFDKEDCGIATLATDQFRHKKHKDIKEGIWFSLAMWKNEGELFNEDYINSWNDTDFIMRQYLKGRKSYRNYNCVVHHEIGATQYADAKHYENFRKNKELFKSRYRDCGIPIYDALINGIVI